MKKILLLILLVQVCQLRCQNGFRSRIYDSNAANQVTYDAFEISPDNYFGAGISIDIENGVPCYKLAVLGLDGAGNQLWIKKIGNPKMQFGAPSFIFRTFCRKDNFFYYGGTMLDSLGRFLATLIKFNHTGDPVWQHFYTDSSEKLIAQALCPAVDGGFLLTGYLVEKGSNEQPSFLIKTDSAGNEIWRKRLNKPTPNSSDGKAIIQHGSSKKIVIAGYQMLGSATSSSQFDNVTILDSSGNLLTRKSYGGMQWHDIIECSDGDIAIVGIGEKPKTGGHDQGRVIKFSLTNPAVPKWEIVDPVATYENSYNSILELDNGNFLVAGSFDSLRFKDQRYNNLSQFVTISANGTVLGRKLFDYATNKTDDNAERLTSMNPTSDGGFITSIRCGYNLTNPFIYVKYDHNFCDSTSEYCESIKVGVGSHSNGENYLIGPNPSEQYLEIIAPAAQLEKVSFTISTSLGIVVSQGELNLEGDYRIDVSNDNPGIYYLILKYSNGNSVTKKFLIVR